MRLGSLAFAKAKGIGLELVTDVDVALLEFALMFFVLASLGVVHTQLGRLVADNSNDAEQLVDSLFS
jgi:hypothetical protein